MKKYRVIFDEEACIGCGACEAICNNWTLEGDIAKPLKIEIGEDEIDENREAEDICPVDAIKIEG